MTEQPAPETTVAIQFQRGSAPYEAGDVAGFPRSIAQRYVDVGAASFLDKSDQATAGDPPVVDDFTAMDRAALIAFGKSNLGMTDEPPAGTSDDALRAALRTAQASAKGTKGGKTK